jgi:hypothetical protein
VTAGALLAPAAISGALAGPAAAAPAVTPVGVAASSSGGGWEAFADGSVQAFGGASSLGSRVGQGLNRPVVGIAATADGRGYWLVASDGGVFSFGDARFYGSTGSLALNRPVVGMASTADGRGYWLVASDGGIFAFGQAGFHGSAGALTLNQPIVGMAATPDGGGYWLVASDGGVFTYGSAPFLGSLAGTGASVAGLAPVRTSGYWLVTAAGLAVPYGNVNATSTPPFGGGRGSTPPAPEPPPVTLPPPPIGGAAHLTFDDEFNGSALAPAWNTCWLYSLGGCSNGDQEGEWYTPNNVSVNAGSLHLTALNQTVQGKMMTTGAPRTYQYTSGMVNTQNTFSFTYGYVEWRAQLTTGKGFWPALWLLPANGTWPPEIDALEQVGTQPDVGNFTYHPGAGQANEASYALIPGLSSGYHTFGVDWEPGRITWYVDSQAVFTATQSVTATAMYLVMNLAVGGSWPGYPDASTQFPSSFNIDYVRVWQH